MKHSIRVKFTMIFIGLMAAVLVSMWAVNSFFLESFYTKQKLQLLENAYENLNAIAVDKEFLGENITGRFAEPVLKRRGADRSQPSLAAHERQI